MLIVKSVLKIGSQPQAFASRALAMAGVATGDVLDRAHLISILQRVAQRDLVIVVIAVEKDVVFAHQVIHWRFVAHIKNLLARANIFFRSTVAVEAKLHLQRSVLIRQRHLVDGPMAGVASHSLVDVDAVIEIHKVGQLIDASPFNRSAGAETLPHRLKISCVRPDLGMAVDAGLGWRDPGETRCLDRSMAVAAVDAEAGHVMLVTEGNRLRFPDSFISDERGSFQLQYHP